MDQNNGGILGKINTPTTTVASGVWSLDSQFESQSGSTWPLAFPQTTIANSCRFDRASGDYLSRTPSGAGNRKIFTFSTWLKGHDAAVQGSSYFFHADISGSSNVDVFGLTATGIQVSINSANSGDLNTTAVFRDLSAWYHMVFAVDTTQGTASNRLKIYVNGTQITAFDTETYPSQDYQFTGFNTTQEHNVSWADSEHNGYLAETIFVDGQQLEPTSFGATNPVTNIWEPIPYAGTYGTNGFRLDYGDSSALGADVSGNSNNFSVNNLTSIDQSTDTCSNNFATLNPLHFGTAGTSNTALSEGNLKFVSTQGGSPYPYYFSTMAVSQGKWYAEFKYVSSDSGTAGIGNGVADQYSGNNAYDYSYYFDGRLYNNGSGESTGYSAISNNDILGCALDLDNNKIYFHINGSYQASGDPANGTGGKSITAAASNGTGVYHFEVGDSGANQPTIECNFGSPSFSISSGNTDANGFGNFEYAVPSGFFALCTKNLAENG